jgi:hypothetical protein
LIKQTIHLIRLTDIKKILHRLKERLNPKGKILIFTLDTRKNEIPTFEAMKIRLNKSLKRDKKILELISKIFPHRSQKKFIYSVKINKKKYLEMIKNRYISTLIPLSEKQLLRGIQEIRTKYKDKLKFRDKLICIIL